MPEASLPSPLPALSPAATPLQECNFTAAAALEAGEAFETPVIHGTVPAGSQQASAAAAGPRPPARQQLMAAGPLQGQLLHERLLLAVLGLMAVAGAVAAVLQLAGTKAKVHLPVEVM